MKNTTIKTVFKLLIFSTLTIILSFSIKAQVIFTDIHPDSIYTGWDVYIFKFDKNMGTNVGEYYLWKHPSNIQLNSFYGGNYVLTDDNNLPLAVDKDFAINESSGKWTTTLYAYLNLNDEGNLGNWINKNDKYLALKITNGAQKYYGWVKLGIDEEPSFLKIQSYAYQSTANTGILAGEGEIANNIEQEKENNCRIIYGEETIQILSKAEDIPKTISIYDISGKVMKTFSPENNRLIIPITEFKKGVYIVSLQYKNTLKNIRIII